MEGWELKVEHHFAARKTALIVWHTGEKIGRSYVIEWPVTAKKLAEAMLTMAVYLEEATV